GTAIEVFLGTADPPRMRSWLLILDPAWFWAAAWRWMARVTFSLSISVTTECVRFPPAGLSLRWRAMALMGFPGTVEAPRMHNWLPWVPWRSMAQVTFSSSMAPGCGRYRRAGSSPQWLGTAMKVLLGTAEPPRMQD